MFGIGKTERKALLIIGFILVALGVSVSQGLVSLSVVREPLDIKIYRGSMSPVHILYQGEKLVIDLTHTRPTYNKFNGGYVYFSIDIGDWKSRRAGNTIWDGFTYTVYIRSDGLVEIVAMDTPFLRADERGIDQPLGWLAREVIIWKGDLSHTKTIVFDFKNHVINAGDKQIPMLHDFTARAIYWWGPLNPPVFTGYIHLYGGYVLKTVKSTPRTTTTRPRLNTPIEPVSPTTTTLTPRLSTPIEPAPTPQTQTTIITHSLPSGGTITQTQTHIILQKPQPLHNQEYNTYGLTALAVGLALIIIAMI